MSAPPANVTTRIPAVDAMRVFAILGVIIIHTCPFRDIPLEKQDQVFNTFGIVLNQLSRFAIPFFFTISGYFWGLKVRGGEAAIAVSKKMIKRLLMVLALWSFVYLLPYNVAAIYQYGLMGPLKVCYWNLLHLASDPFMLLFESTIAHMWFLIALIWSVTIAAFFVSKAYTRSLIVVAVALHVFGILALAYATTPIGITFPFYTLDGPFFGTIFFVTGYLLSGRTPRAEWLVPGILFAVLGFVIHFSEMLMLWEVWGVKPTMPYVFGTWFIGLGVTMIALANPRLLRSEALARAGQLTLGVYAVHLIFVEWTWSLAGLFSGPLWEIGRVVGVYAASLAVVAWMAKNPRLVQFVK